MKPEPQDRNKSSAPRDCSFFGIRTKPLNARSSIISIQFSVGRHCTRSSAPFFATSKEITPWAAAHLSANAFRESICLQRETERTTQNPSSHIRRTQCGLFAETAVGCYWQQ
jgi:hypothetical protein